MIVTTPEAERLHQLDALGAALVDARKSLIHGAKIANELGLTGFLLHSGAAIAAIDDAMAAVQSAGTCPTCDGTGVERYVSGAELCSTCKGRAS